MIASSHQPQPQSAHQSIQYRQLVSRALTQRLHSPSLDNSISLSTNSFAVWELNERKAARESSKAKVQELGVSWEKLLLDVEAASREVHFLTPKRYQESKEAKVKEQLEGVSGLGCGYKSDAIEEERQRDVEEKKAWKEVSETHVNALRAFGHARMQG